MSLISNNIINILRQRVKQEPEFVLYRWVTYESGQAEVRDITIQMIYEKSLEMAYTLRSKGLKKGDRAVIFCMQDFGTMYAIIGCMMAGVVFTVIPPPLDEGKVDRFISVLKSCSPRALISNYELEHESGVNITGRLIREALPQVIRLKRVYTDRLVIYHKPDVIVPAQPDDLVYLQYTSGSTSAPKGVRITWKNLMKQMDQCDKVYDFENETLATWVPFFHNLGLVITVIMPICTRKAVGYYMNTMEFLSNPKNWIRMMSEFKLTMTLAPGSAFDICTRIFSEEEAAKYDLSHTTMLMNGSEFVSAHTIEEFSRLFKAPYLAAAPGYGLAEAVCLVSVAARDYRALKLDYEAYQKNRVVLSDAENAKEIVSLGRPIDGLTVLAVNPKTRKAYSDLHIGEICVQGDSVADGYWGGIRDNKNFHFRVEGYEGDFYRTGDLGFLHEGRIYLTGRLKEMMIVNGHNIYPGDLMLELEKKIPEMTGAAIAFFAVTGERKERIVACMETSAAANLEKRAARINRVIADRFEFSFHDIVFVKKDSLPRTDNRKIQTLKIKDAYINKKLDVIYSTLAVRGDGPADDRTETQKQKAAKEDDADAKNQQNVQANAVQELSAAGLGDRLRLDKFGDELLGQVKSVFDKVLKIDHYSLTDSFLELGGDSLTGFELVNSIEQKFNIKLDLRELLEDSSVAGVTAYLRRVLSGIKITGKKVDWKAETRLEPEISPEGDYTVTAEDCRRFFLTGATGFLGTNLIRALIEQAPHDGLKIYCHVRAKDEAAGMKRVVDAMKKFNCWKEGYDAYIKAVPGDLTQPNLGIAEETYEMLAEEVDAVYHNGAMLNFVFPYEYLKKTNVFGTREALRLACAKKPKYFHYISSYSVFDTPRYAGTVAMENDPLPNGKGFTLAYSETKWVSEKLVCRAKDRGLRTVIYRPGDIVGAADGIWNVEDMVSRMIVGSIQMKSVPPIGFALHMTPVDYVGNAIVHISRKEQAVSQAFHIVNPKKIRLRDLMKSVRRCGYTVNYTPFLVWRNKLRKSDSNTNALSVLECLFENDGSSKPSMLRHFLSKETIYDATNTKIFLEGTGIMCPPIDDRMIAAYLRYFRKLGYID